MRIAIVLFLAACGASSEQRRGAAPSPPPPSVATVSDVQPVPPSVPAECTGDDIDLAKAIASPACQGAAGGSTIDALNRLEVRIAPPSKVAPSAKGDIEVILVNTSDAAVSLRLLPFPWSAVTKTSMGTHPCGTGAQGAAILRQMEGLHAPAPSSAPAGQIVIPPKGKARAKIPWEANGKKWGPAQTDKGTCHADAVAIPLAAGKYTVTVRVPAVGVTIPEQQTSILVAP
jgi:hypothetical protein